MLRSAPKVLKQTLPLFVHQSAAKVWFGSFSSAYPTLFPGRFSCLSVCLLRFLQQCRSHCYHLLDWNAHAHQNDTRVRADFICWTQNV